MGTTGPVLLRGAWGGYRGIQGGERARWVPLAKLGGTVTLVLVLGWWDQAAASHSPVQKGLFGAGSWARLGDGGQCDLRAREGDA